MTPHRRAEARPDILVLRALGVGDLLTAVPAVRGLARGFPEHDLILLAPPALEPLVRLIGGVDRLIPAAPLAPLEEAPPIPKIAVNLHGRGPQSSLVLLRTRPLRLIAFAHAEVPETAGGPEWRADEHEVARWCRLLAEEGIAADPRDLDIHPPGIPVARELIGATVLHPGAASAARRWPLERWAAVAADQARRGQRVVLTGGLHERALADDVARMAGLVSDAVLAGRTDLAELAAVVAAANVVVCGDTGVAHLATALRTPSVVLFGPTSPAHWGPPPERTRHRVLWKGGSGDPHGGRPDPGLLAISIDEVLDALRAIEAVPDVESDGRAEREPLPAGTGGRP
ncbi:glycosyltransferase family 9 protein [soil metagenome]